ncbi:MAG: efflux RND transporter periplasmic adaptor subunit [candidate division KSB1 bacterium]|nr:efflux RND transporter periplasmic adaptor subunit [candidate division KSB1 bacterium]
MLKRHSSDEQQVVITERQMQSADIQLGSIQTRHLSDQIEVFGEIVLPPSARATLSAVVGGVVRDIQVIEGDYVSKGDILTYIEHPDVAELQKDYLQALVQSEYLRTEYERQKQLFEDQVGAARDFQKAKAEYFSNQVLVGGLKQKLKLMYIDPETLSPETMTNRYAVQTPISGYVADVNVNTGLHIAPQQSLAMIMDTNQLHIDLRVYENDMPKIHTGQRLVFTLANQSKFDIFEGSIMKTARQIDPQRRTALVHASIADPQDSMLPGMPVWAHIQAGGEKAAVLPEEAFVTDQGTDYVFQLVSVSGEEGHHTGETHAGHAEHAPEPPPEYVFEKLHVKTGLSGGGYITVRFETPVSEQAQFAVHNAQALLSEMKKGGDGHGHAH